MPELSVVITILNEEKNIRPLLEQVRAALAGIDYEIIWVDDGSTDNSKQEILKLADEHNRLVVLDRNFGQSAAMRAGIEHASGQYTGFLDGDGQNDPADLPLLLQLLKQGNYDVVAGNREKRQDGFWLRKIPSRIANWLIRVLTGVYVKDYGCTLRVFKKDIAAGLQLYGGLHRFIPVLATIQGAKMIQTGVRHHARIAGKSKYGLGRIFPVLKDLALLTALRRFPNKPRRIAAPAGVICLLSGIVTLVILSINKGGSTPDTMNFLYTPAILLILTGILLIAGRKFVAGMIAAHRIKAAVSPYSVSKVYRGVQSEATGLPQ